MSLPEIPAIQPTVIPAVPEKEFAHYWLQKLHVEGRPEGATRVYAEMKPYNRSTGECSPADVSDVRALEIPSVFGLSDPSVSPALSEQTRGLIHAAMSAILTAMSATLSDEQAYVPPVSEGRL